MKYTIDRIEENIVILEDRNTKKMIEVSKDILPTTIHEGSILTYKNNRYEIDKTEEEKKRKEIEERWNRLKSN